MSKKKQKVPAADLMDRALAVTFESDVGHLDIRGFLYELLSTLWSEEESFSGKRPLGNSGWQYAPVEALVKAGVCKDEEEATGLFPFLIAHALNVEVL